MPSIFVYNLLLVFAQGNPNVTIKSRSSKRYILQNILRYIANDGCGLEELSLDRSQSAHYD